MNKKNITTLQRIMQKYKLEILDSVEIPQDILKKYGPISQVQRIQGAWWILCSGVISDKPLDSLIVCDNDFSNVVVIYQFERISSFCYDFRSGHVWLVQHTSINPFSDRDKAFSSKDNAIVICDRNGSNVQRFRPFGEALSYPIRRIVVLSSGIVVFFDFALQQLVFLSTSGTVEKTIAVGNKYIKTIKTTNNDDIYFITMSKINVNREQYDDPVESIYKVVGDKIELLSTTEYEGKYTPQYSNSIYDIEIVDNHFYYVSDSFFGKINMQGNCVYKTSLSDRPSPNSIVKTPICMSRDREDNNIIHIGSWGCGGRKIITTIRV